MRNSHQTRFLALMLVAVMIIGFIPTHAFAAEETQTLETAAATEETTPIASEETQATEETQVAEETQQTEGTTSAEVDVMSDAELLAQYAQLCDEEAETFVLSLTEPQQNRLASLLEGVALCGESRDTHTVFKNTASTLAPGVTQNIKYAYAADGKQMVYYIATADVTREDVVVQSSYYKQHEGGVMGMAKLTEQAAYANQKYTNQADPLYISDYYHVVAGVNSSFYNMSTGQPLGITFIDGVSFGTNDYDNFFAILKDGKTAVIDYSYNLSKYVDENGESTIWQAAAGSAWLVRDGKDVTANASGSYNTDRHSRTCVGVTAEGKVVLMVLDGRQEPFSCGGTFHELAQIMLEAGCVAAVNLDGGGSTTYASKPAGSDEFLVLNRPSDGSERAISAGIIVASTAIPSNVFESAILTVENDYVTPESSVKLSAVGVSPAGTSAQIPDEATWQVQDTSMGAIVDGAFVSSGKVGDAVIQMVYQEKVVGEATIHVVIPDLAFTTAEMTVPYNKTFALKVVGTTNGGLNAVTLKDGDVKFELSDPKMGTIEGNSYTTCSETAGVTGGFITAKCVWDESKTATATVKFGRASEIVYDFENGDATGWLAGTAYSNHPVYGRFETASVALVDQNTGKVRNGNYALALTADFSTTTASGYKAVKFTLPKPIDLADASAFGMWMYLPVDANNLEFDIGKYEFYPEKHSNIQGESWYYISASTALVGSSVSKFTIYMTDPDETYANIYDKFIIYIDDLTIDYSNATDDREIPLFTDVNISTGLDSFVAMNGQTISTNTFIVKASVQDDLTGNYTGLDITSAKVYVDGVQLAANQFSCDNSGMITVSDITLPDGTHTFRFEISDNTGNVGFVTKQVVVNTEKGDVTLLRRNAATVQPLAGSIEYFDVVAKQAQKIQTITLQLDLDTLSAWELQGSEVAYGFELSYYVDARSNTAYVTLTKTEKAVVAGETVLASLPVRVWQTSSYLNPEYIAAGVVSETPGNENSTISTPSVMWQTDRARFVRIELNAESILVQYTDGTNASFSQKQINVITEYNRYRSTGYYTENGNYITGDTTFVMQGKSSTHIHTETAMEDKAATCTEQGYTGRTHCEGCDSVLNWGVSVSAIGHSYEVVDGVLKCRCGVSFTGTWTDGKDYVDGILVGDGWNGDYYYLNGVKLTGIQKVSAPDGSGEFYYDFGEDGINKGKYTGLFFDETVQAYRYLQWGEFSSGWKQIENDWYYFRQATMTAATGHYHFGENIYYDFEETGRLTHGVWVTDEKGTRYFYGPTYYRSWGDNILWVTIDGGTYCFDKHGYRLLGLHVIHESNDFTGKLYNLTEDGQATLVSMVYNDYLYLEGIRQLCYQLVEFEGDFYFINDGHKIAKNTKLYLSEKYVNGKTFPDGTPVAVGTYEFDAEGKMVVKNGPLGDYFYAYGVKQSRYQLVSFGGNFYFINDGDKLAKNVKLYMSEKFVTGKAFPDGTPVAPGLYEFDADGKMVVKNGPEGDYFYVYGVKQSRYQLVSFEGDFYFINDGDKLAKSIKLYLSEKFVVDKVFPDGTPVAAGLYEFDADGKMVVENGPVGDYFYVYGVKQSRYQLVSFTGDFYFINDGDKLAKNVKLYLSEKFVTGKAFPDGTPVAPGLYEFDADGKMVVENGPVGDYFYVYGVKQSRYQLVSFEGDFYFINDGDKLAKNVKLYLSEKFVTGKTYPDGRSVQPGLYYFDSEGKMH